MRYDQLGGGKSDRISDTTQFTIEHFVTELEITALRPYEHWAEDLKTLAKG